MLSRKYKQRTKSWDSKIIKKAKDYAYVTLMIAKILDSRMADKKSVKRKVHLSDEERSVHQFQGLPQKIQGHFTEGK
jgi:hypothetical protein